MTLSVLRLYLAARVLKRVGVDAESDAWVIADLDEPDVIPRRGPSVLCATGRSQAGWDIALPNIRSCRCGRAIVPMRARLLTA